jgi:hypothetical protein
MYIKCENAHFTVDLHSHINLYIDILATTSR